MRHGAPTIPSIIPLPGSPGKSQNEGPEDQGEVEELRRLLVLLAFLLALLKAPWNSILAVYSQGDEGMIP